MKIIDPQSAVLTNVEVLAYLDANPPRRPPNPPSKPRNWVPSPDLRDHNTVVKEIHNYVARLSPYLLKYPRYTARPSSQSRSQEAMTGTINTANTNNNNTAHTNTNTSSNAFNTDPDVSTLPPPPSSEPTPMDRALRDLVTRLQPYGLTKAEVVMILNLGIGMNRSDEAADEADRAGAEGVNGDGQMEADYEEHMANGTEAANGGPEEEGGREGGGEEVEPEGEADDYGPLALLDTVIEEREERLANEDVEAVLAIVRETLAGDYESS
ncbi:hypothetical protein NUU61_003335 [Penicillium alfredii]|uniref:DNA-directed RNA polymerase III subunit RPC9 n=1 Tax=Penicillium alfredii TaxID=1506179 RepID=A0A9W9KHV5_9EURO|nr:uncharacterized protein NUU61_003335 [Penicillium alfredii]KAJ5105988.1 hypothetical protein NUU61_003335 [Penicillium alfredii]